MKRLVLIAAFILFSGPEIPGAEGSMKSSPQSGRILLLHYRWRHDALVLIDKKWVKGAVKPVRGASGRAKNAGDGAATTESPRSPFSYELVSADGSPLSTVYLPEPGIRRVETQEKGEKQLRPRERKLDSSDVFLRVSDPEAKSIRFYRHGHEGAMQPNPNPVALPKSGAGSGSNSNSTTQAAASKTLLAEFPLD